MNSSTKLTITAVSIIILLILTVTFPTNTMILAVSILSSILFLYFTYKVLSDGDAVPDNSRDELPVP